MSKKKISTLFISILLSSIIALPSNSAVSTEITFDNLFQSRKLISQVTWSKFNAQAQRSDKLVIPVKVLVGPNTKPTYKTPVKAFNLVAQGFDGYQLAKKVTLIQYQFVDMKWAENTLKKMVTSDQYQLFSRNESGKVFDSHCVNENKNCYGAKALTAQSGEAFILHGVMNELPVGKSEKIRMTTGMLEAHEYFHTIQDVPFRGKNLPREKFPPAWLTEGSAELVQNLAINQKSYKDYLYFIKENSMSLYGNYINRDPAYLSEYLDFQNNKNNWENYENDVAYSLGSRICEILVAVKGPNSLLDMHYEMSKGKGFESAFSKVYGKSWKQVQPIIAKTLAANIKDYL